MNALIVYEIMCAKTFKDSKGQENLRFFLLTTLNYYIYSLLTVLIILVKDDINYFIKIINNISI